MVLLLSYSPLDVRFAGSNPAGVNGLFQSVKILSKTSFGREVKPWVRVIDLWHVGRQKINFASTNILNKLTST